MKKGHFIFSAIIACISVACDRNNETVIEKQPQSIEKELFEQNEYNLDLKDFALTVSSVMSKNEDFRRLIKKEALNMFDGDFDVLLNRIVDKPIASYGETVHLRSGSVYTVKDLLEDFYVDNSNSSGLRAGTTSIINSLTEKYPNLQITVPVNIGNWDETTTTPIVTFVPSEFKDGVTQYVTAYKSDGSSIALDAINPPTNEPVIVISENERSHVITVTDRPFTPYTPGEPGVPVPPTPVDLMVPPTPTNLTAAQTAVGVMLSWKETMETSNCRTIGYNIYRKSPSDSNFKLLSINNGIYNIVYYDQTTQAGLTYNYYIRAYNSKGESMPSNLISAVGTGRPASVLSFEAKQQAANEIELRWSTDNNQYIQKLQLYKYTVGSSNGYQLYKEFGANDYDYIDNNAPVGKMLKYKMQIATPTGNSSPKYDFIQVPYRDPSKYSPVRIKKIKCNSDVESFLRGAPEFCIKVLGVNNVDRTKSYEIQSEIYIAFGGDMFGWSREQSFNVFVINWKPAIWYDALTFYVREDDGGGQFSTDFNTKVNYKKDFAEGLGIDNSISANYKFSTAKSGDEIGYGYLDYFEEKSKWIVFPRYDFQMYIDDK